ncbi:MAG TPA: anaerobic sulfatase maturase, partial [Armatimonadetes bacterium]|nr:anaerobic sulfatase maturase [Armatimonadota bacterium]
MKPFSLLIKPASADCNLRCAYCFYLEKSGLYPYARRHRMPDDVLDRLIRGYMSTNQPVYSFVWQGGEPALMGLGFFRKVTELQQQYGRSGAVVSNGLQTNATLIDDELAAHLARYRFLVGVSLDGPADIHDFYRRRSSGEGTHADVLTGIECLRRNRVEFNALTLVTSANACRGGEVYRYLRDTGCCHHQYIPCVEFDAGGKPQPWSITGKEWGGFLCRVFDEWHAHDTRRVSVRLFDSILAYMVDGTRNICQISQNCCQYFLVEYNGDVYPCDFFADPDLRLGNISSDNWAELQESEKYRAFGELKSSWDEQCLDCEYMEYCMGDCLKHRTHEGVSPSHLCDGWKTFFAHSLPAFREIARR